MGAHSQVLLDVPIALTGGDDERTVRGVAIPNALSGGVSVEAAVLGIAHWGTFTMVGDTLRIDLNPAEIEDRVGVLLRGLLPSLPHRQLYVRLGDRGARPLIHRDGTMVHGAGLAPGTVVEVLTGTDAHLLTALTRTRCPMASIPLNEATCIDTAAINTSASFYQAARICAERGGRLCAWDEYIAACNLLGPELNGLFNDWEWINDTSNHTHTVDQAGRTTCISQRSAAPNAVGTTRCCYRSR
jgi:hypothetical protein